MRREVGRGWGDANMSWCLDIEREHKMLFLIYDDTEAWVLGHACKVLLVKSLNDL